MSTGGGIRGLVLPGYGDSGPTHWQSRWEARHPGLARVRQQDWLSPSLGDWVRTLESGVCEAGPDVVLIAHSLGCLLAVHWLAATRLKVRGALLVAPPDPRAQVFPRGPKGFTVPSHRLPCPSVVVASSADPYATPEFSSHCAISWGSSLVNAGPAGHVNGDSGLGGWDEGWRLVEALRAG